MGRVVIKLGSSIVADERGELRADALERICAVVADRRAAGDGVVVVSSGAIARGMAIMELGGRPREIQDLQAASAVGQGKLYRVSGPRVDRLIARHDLENEEALAHVEHRLGRMGVLAALERAGFEPGEDVEIGGVVFELDPGAPF